MAINPIVATVSIVTQLRAGVPVGSASGFFYERNNILFLVTNQHVMRNDAQGVIPDTLRLRLHRDASNITSNEDFDVALYNGTERLWKVHPNHPTADVALIKLDKAVITSRYFIKAWRAQDFLPTNYVLDPGLDVFIMGYPLGFHDAQNNLPIFRSAMIASTYQTHFLGKPMFLTDANLHPGTSGSPVITKPKSTWVDDQGNTNIVTGTVYYLVGVHSGTVAPQAGQPPLGLGAAWYASLVEDIAGLF